MLYNVYMSNRAKYNVFLFVSTFARALVEIFISLFLFKNGFSLNQVLLVYLLENVFALFISYAMVRIGERYNYAVVMCIGIVAFIILQAVLSNPAHDGFFIILLSFLYSLYRRGYWVARRYYVTKVVPRRDSSGPFSIMMVVSEVASISAGFLGGSLLDGFNVLTLTILSSALLFVSAIPLLWIKGKSSGTKVELMKNLKKYDKKNYLAFSLFEINNVLTFIFPIFVTLYIKETYMMAGVVSAVSGLAIIVFILIYGRVIRKRNYFILSTVLFIAVSCGKLLFLDYAFLALCFVEGIIKKMQEQSLNKIYFENRGDMDLTHYNLIYQTIGAFARIVVVIPLLFMNDVRMMIMFVLTVICINITIYACSVKKSGLA